MGMDFEKHLASVGANLGVVVFVPVLVLARVVVSLSRVNREEHAQGRREDGPPKQGAESFHRSRWI